MVTQGDRGHLRHKYSVTVTQGDRDHLRHKYSVTVTQGDRNIVEVMTST